MAINYTAINPLTATLATTPGYTGVPPGNEVTVLAFGWADAEPETTTGVWVLGQDAGQVIFVPASGIERLEPCNPKLEAAIEETRETADSARDLANRLNAKVVALEPTRQTADSARDVANRLTVKVAALEPAHETARRALDLANELHAKVAALEQTGEIALRALDLASKAHVKIASLTQEVLVTEGVAVGAMDVALETHDELQERDEADAEAAFEDELLAEEPADASLDDEVAPPPRSGASRPASKSSASSKTASRTSAGRGTKGNSQQKVK